MVDLHDLKHWFKKRNFKAIHDFLIWSISTSDYEYIHHPLGFLLTEIFRQDESVIRLHYWKHDLATSGSAVTPYHDHIWRLSSCVLFGEIENCILEVQIDPEGEYLLTEVEQSGRVDNVPAHGDRASFKIKKRERLRRGDFYYLPPRVFHFSGMVEGTDALTLVLSETEIDGSPRTLMPLGVPGHAPVRKKIANSSEVSSEILSNLGV
ncbi:hypothetical protein [Roseovarius nitratireducens]|uniref:hypothetical protein n=1 Tax=Roseovarius nitratireducens TaxID=2044597 RepID=UPI00101ADC9C|nr:hypothetical protein [Roseovarius nitratireducens]